MELRHLRYFVIVAEEQNVTRAAERLHVSQPPLSRQIRDLEEELGVALFRRTAKSVTLTEPGKVFLNEARAVLLRAETAVEAVRAAAHGDQGSLRIGYAPSLTARILPAALRAFETASPGVRVSLHDLSSEECLQRLAARELDLALTVPADPSVMRGLLFEELIRYPICCALAVTHPLAAKRSLRLEQLQAEKFIIYHRKEYPEYHAWLLWLSRQKGFEPRAVEEYDGVAGLINAVAAGRGVALVPTSIRCLTGPRLKLSPLVPELPPVIVGALRSKSSSPLATRFVAFLKEAAQADEAAPVT